MRAFVPLVCVFAMTAAFAQEDPHGDGGRADALRQHTLYREALDELELKALAIRRAQDRFLAARQALAAFRQGKTPKQLQSSQLREEAKALFQAAKAAQLDYESKAQGEAGRRYGRLKDAGVPRLLKQLRVALDLALKRLPDDVELRRVRAALRLDLHLVREARADLGAVLEEEPNDPIALTLLGRCEEDAGRVTEALALFRQALATAPSDALRVRCALACVRLNKVEEARSLRDRVRKPDALPVPLQMDWDTWLASPVLEQLCERWRAEGRARFAERQRADLPRVSLSTTRGEIVVELFEDQARNTVANFVELVEAGFYDGLTWHRVHPFYAQTGDPATRAGADPEVHGPGYAVKDELGENARGRFRGSLVMANESGPNTGGSQFSILLRPLPQLGGRLTCFGRVVEGLELVGKLRQGDRLSSARVLRKRTHRYEAEKID